MAIKNKQRGFTLLIALIFMSVVLAFGLALASLSYKQQVLASSDVESQYAFYAADAGLECALYYDQPPNNLFAYPPDPTNGSPDWDSLKITCDGNLAALKNHSYSPTNSPNPELILEEELSLYPTPQQPLGTRCADITIYKPYSQNNSPELTSTYIFSQGYDVPCGTVDTPAAGARIVSRGINIRY